MSDKRPMWRGVGGLLGVAFIGAVLGYLAGVARGGSSTPEPSERCDPSELERVKRELASLRPAGSGAPFAAEGDGGPRDENAIPRLVEFKAPSGISVTQRENGTLKVENRDPNLTGKEVRVEGVTADGKHMTFDVRVPAPRAGE